MCFSEGSPPGLHLTSARKGGLFLICSEIPIFLKLSSLLSCVSHPYSAKVSNQLPDLTAGWKWPAEFFISAAFSLGSFELAQNKLQAPQLSHPFMGLIWKQKQCPTGHTERLLKLSWWEKRTHWPRFNSSLSNLTSRFNFPKLPSLEWHLGWLVCPVLCVLQSNYFKC